MAKYLKPQTPLQHQSGDYIYPITTVDQIITANGERLNSKIVVVDTENVNIGGPNPVNADTLGGINASEYATKDYVNQQIRKDVPRNLLDNSDFRIAQAGYLGLHDDKTYVADRWISAGITSASMESNGIVLSSDDQYDYCYQKLEGMAGKTVTFAAKGVSTGKLRIRIYDSSVSVPYASASIDNGIAICTCTIPTDMDIICLLIYPDNNNATGNATIEWAALYEGEYTADNLPAYQPKGYGAELLECMRYFIRGDDRWNLAFAETRGAYLIFEVPCPCEMRVTPSIAGGEMRLYAPSGWVTVTVPAWNKYFHGGKYSCFVTKSNISGLDIVANTNYMMTGTPALCADL